MKEVLIRAVASLLFYTGALKPLRHLPERFRLEKKRVAGLSLPWLARREHKIIQIITHHRVNDEFDPFLPATPTKVFAKHTKYLASHYNVCNANDLLHMLETNDVPDRAIVITFDDGYRDNLLNACPVLQELDVPAIIFLPVDHIGTGRLLWHDQVACAFRETVRTSMPAYGHDGANRALDTTEQKVKAFRATVGFLRTLNSESRSRWIDRLCDDLEVTRRVDAPSLMLSWDEVRIAQAGGISFGSHTVTHPILSRLRPESARHEIVESKKLIEAKLDVPVRVLAYPNGTPADFTEANKAAAKAAGYDCALTTIFGVNQPGDDLFELKRGAPWEEYLPAFALKLIWYRLSF